MLSKFRFNINLNVLQISPIRCQSLYYLLKIIICVDIDLIPDHILGQQL